MAPPHQKVLALMGRGERCSFLSEPATSYYFQQGDVLLVCFMVDVAHVNFLLLLLHIYLQYLHPLQVHRLSIMAAAVCLLRR